MINSSTVKAKAREYGADITGIGCISAYEGTKLEHDPRFICPTAKCVIGLGIRIPEGMIRVLEAGNQLYSLTSLYTKSTGEELVIMLLLKMARLLENEGYEACIQRTSPNIKAKDDYGMNPEVSSVTRLGQALSVDPGKKPAPEVLLDFAQSAVICGLGSISYRGEVLTPQYGPFQRLAYIITNAPLEADPVFDSDLCDKCGKCADACPGKAIIRDEKTTDIAGRTYTHGTFDSWQCSVYYRGAHRSNPYMNDEFLKGDPDREAVLNGEKRFDEKSAKEMYPKMKFLPPTQFGYVPCMCRRACDIACYNHLKEKGLIRKGGAV
ncbi:MAG: 4Fe-4S binding protein [Eubacteriales bacterium]|nr:4Fe-4S binding protein [Eubacteriales bacterium]